MTKYSKEVQVSIVLIIFSFILTTFESSMVMPMGPIITSQYLLSGATITYLNLGFNLAGLFTPVMGYFSDKYSAKKALIAGMLFFSFGCFIVSFNQLWSYVIGRFVLGVGYYSLLTLRFAYTSKIVDSSSLSRVSGYYKVAFAIGAILSPYGGKFLLDYFSFQTIYLIIGFISLVLTLAMGRLVEARKEERIVNLGIIINLVKEKRAQLAFLASLFISLPTIFFYTYASVFLSGLGKTSGEISLYYTMASLGSVLAGFLLSSKNQKLDIYRIPVLFSVGAAISLMGVSFFPIALLPAFFFGLCFDMLWGVFYPSCSLYFAKESAIFLTVLGMLNAGINLISALVAPTLFVTIGYSMLIFICACGLYFASILIKASQKGLKEG